VKPSKKRAKTRIEYHDENAKRKLAPALTMKVETRTNFVLTLAIMGDTNSEANASPKLTILDKNAIYP